MKGWLPLAGIGLLAGLAGVSLLLAGRHAQPPAIEAGPVDASPAAIHAAQFRDGEGATRSLGQFAGKVGQFTCQTSTSPGTAIFLTNRLSFRSTT